MREILFRGKSLRTEDWLEGSLFIDDKGEKREILVGYVNYRISWEVDPKTVGQYTGLKDKNGKKIFEGDIVRHHNGSLYADSDNIELGKVYWDEKYCGWRRTSNGAFYHGCVDNYRISPDCVYEVVGNIHDNPELLGGA